MTVAPSPEQQAILDLGLTSIRVRAGAGTGKTTTVAMVIANLVAHHGIEPERVLGLTFTNKAAAELANRVAEFLPGSVDPGRQVEVHTYHGFAAQVLAEFGLIAGVDSRTGVITPTFSRQLIFDVFYRSAYDHLDMTNARTIDRIRSLGDELGDHLLVPEEVRRSGVIHADDPTWAERLEMLEALASYNRAKAELGVVDYSDLVTVSTRLMQEHSGLAHTIRARYQALVLDEYQDTNPAQRVLLTTIFGGGFPVVAVGDEDQTIYEWRGASPENFAQFLEHFPTPDGSPAHDRSLTLNRRSGREILDVANEVRVRANSGAQHLSPVGDEPAIVTTHWASDAIAEAEWVARRFGQLHDEGEPWSQMAVLLRKNKDFAVLIDVLSRHDIPIEVANVGGLMSVPEISSLRAWLMMLDNPEDSTALSQILFGSDYRIGLADLAALTRWLATVEKEDSEDPDPVTMVEALERIDEVPGLNDRARERLTRFYEVFTSLLVESQSQSLADICRLVLDRTRAWQHVEALPSNPRLSARLNIYRFLDLADDWSPLSGRPSLSAFLEYLVAMEDEPSDQLDSARLSGEDAVTLLTVHRAKGLEWDTVAIPTLAKGNFPSRPVGAYPDPYSRAESLPPEMRLDNVLDLPEDDTARKAFLRRRHEVSEWRVAYVAMTRARRRLLVSGAHWYGHPEPLKNPVEPSELFELAESHPSSINDGHAALGPRPELLRAVDDVPAPDPLFAAGWQAGLRMAIDDAGSLDKLASDLGVSDRYEEQKQMWGQRLFDLSEIESVKPVEDVRSISVTGLVTYAQCPKRFFWADVDPLPRRRNEAAVRGSEIHRRIELHQRGEVPFDDLEPDLYDAVDESRPGAFANYESSRFAEARAAAVETPFVLNLENEYRIRGRIDAIYAHDDTWEIVDFKTGTTQDDPARIVQLQAYAVAANECDLGLGSPSRLDVSFAYLGGGLAVETTHADTAWVESARERLLQITDGIRARAFGESPGRWCGNCDFLQFCGPGQAEVGES